MKQYSLLITILFFIILATVGEKSASGRIFASCEKNGLSNDTEIACDHMLPAEISGSQIEKSAESAASPDTYLPIVTMPMWPYNLMPMGDSLVEGWYWVPEFFFDHKDSCDFKMVGSTAGDNVWVPSREGHGGATTSDYLAQQWHTKATATYDPDVILLMLGTNDFSNPSANAATVAGRLQQIVDEIHAVKQHVTIFVAIIPRADANMQAYNAALQTMSDVIYIDQFSGFNPKTMTVDGVHPNGTGSQVMADMYFSVLQSLGFCP